MHRLNRVGEHIIQDVSSDDFLLDASTAEMAASLGTPNLPQVQTDTTVVGDKVSCVKFNTGDAALVWTMTALTSYSFGRFVNGASINGREVMIGYTANLAVVFASGLSAGSVVLKAGIHNTTAVTVDKTAQTNLIDTQVMLAQADQQIGSRIHVLQAKGTLVNTIFDGGKAGEYDTNPLGIFFQVTNYGGSNAIQFFNGSLSIYRYSSDIDTFDPTR